ncbi:MAG: MaoC family dehydratase N-terminal domain-containing protein [Halioglobus sp.]|nr:MaoC family dehydratase N-terminal domain-containing protein [Halioglobus sp.]
MNTASAAGDAPELQALIGRRKGPYLGYNPVSRVQIWQWCSAMGDRNPLYLDEVYQREAGFDGAVAPPAMMQMWTMRDVDMRYAPGSSAERPYEIMDVLSAAGYPGNVAVSYDLHFHRLLREGDRAHHYNTIASISGLKTTALGEGYFFVEHAQFYDQQETLFAEAFITYFQYAPAQGEEAAHKRDLSAEDPPSAEGNWQPDFKDVLRADIEAGTALPELAIPITHKLIVAGAVASQDFIDVHHNAPAARAAAMPDIFMNILTTCGLCARYLTDWAGPGSRLTRLQLQLLAPNTPGDTMLLQGTVKDIAAGGDPLVADVEFAGRNSRGYHVTGSAAVKLAG